MLNEIKSQWANLVLWMKGLTFDVLNQKEYALLCILCSIIYTYCLQCCMCLFAVEL